MQDFAGKVAVITGAANGIGRALTRLCARQGMHVVLADIDSAALDLAAAELASAGHQGLAMTCDVAQPSDVEELANVAFGSYGAVHLLVNNAGIAGTVGPCWDISPDHWDRDLAVNLAGPLHALRAFVPRLLAQGGEAHIVNVASIMGLLPTPMAASYGAAKAALVALSEALALELRQLGAPIGVSLACPAAVATSIAHSLRVPAGDEPAVRAGIHAQLQQGLSPDSVAEAILAAVRRRQFAVFPDDSLHPHVRARLDALLAGHPPLNPGV